MRNLTIFFIICLISLGLFTLTQAEASPSFAKLIVCYNDPTLCNSANYTINLPIYSGKVSTLNLGGCLNGNFLSYQTSNQTWICTTGTSGTDTNTAQGFNLTSTNGYGLGIFENRLNATQLAFRTITCGSGMTCSTNATNLRINSTALTSAITSINADTTAAQLVKGNSALSNVTVTDSGATHRIGIGSAVVILNGTKQTFTKDLDLGQGIKDTFANTALYIRNVASSFTYNIVGGAITGNRTLNLPLTVQTETFSTTGAYNFTQPANKTATSSTVPVVLGAYATFRPHESNNATITVTGYAQEGNAGNGCRVSIIEDTSYLGNNGAAVLATKEKGANLRMTSATASASVPFSQTYLITGLTGGTKYFFDLDFARIGAASTCTIFNVSWEIEEKS